jgi:hypothetical protein
MLRIFRTKFNNLKEAEEELKRVNLIARFLAPDHMAMSNEFLVDYTGGHKRECILCGLQEYVEGEAINPWTGLDRRQLITLFNRMVSEKNRSLDTNAEKWLRAVRKKAANFIGRLRGMVLEANTVPDLAGAGNLIITLSGNIKLVDINNISKVSFDATIPTDDRGYPVCDRSIEALALLEEGLLCKRLDEADTIYRFFLDPDRMKTAKALEKTFYRTTEPASYPVD